MLNLIKKIKNNTAHGAERIRGVGCYLNKFTKMNRKQEINEQIVNFLKDAELISRHRLEKKLGLSQALLHKCVQGDREIPTKHLYTLILELIQYGFKLDGFTWEQPDPHIPHIFGRKYVEDCGFEEKDGEFTYTVKEYRTMAADLEDLL